MYAVLSGEIEPPSKIRPEIPPELDEIVLKALQRNPDERWQTAREMGRALHRFLARQEEPIGNAELADWMNDLFPNGEARKRRLMEIAQTDEPIPPLRSSVAPDQSGRRGIPTTARRRPPNPGTPLPASVLVIAIGVVTVLAAVAVDWFR